ncbi:MAG TPA: hypothetical protein VHY20_01515 [Pirellulales bacterium]|jgi:hypothetical protein|nr:hypothetical protein [Pirellulales bacterium]
MENANGEAADAGPTLTLEALAAAMQNLPATDRAKLAVMLAGNERK